MGKRSKFLGSFVLAFALVAGAGFVSAQPSDVDHAEIEFPVVELGGCADEEECKSYCDQPGNINACIDFAEKNGLMDAEEIETARKFGRIMVDEGGPRGCRNQVKCEEVCSNMDNLNVCLEFAERHGHSDRHIEEGRKIQKYLEAGNSMPGGCRSERECETYCSDFAHMRECTEFARELGFDDDFDDRGERSGDRRDDRPSAEQMEEMLVLIESGDVPGACESKVCLERYCGVGDRRGPDPEHMQECFDFGRKVGFISDEEAEIFEKTGGKGPGGCFGEKECRMHCENPDNQEECFAFASEHGLLDEGHHERFDRHREEMRRAFDHMPPEVKECLSEKFGEDAIGRAESGGLSNEDLMRFGRQMGDTMQNCFRQNEGAEFDRMFSEMPPEVADCTRAKLGNLGSLPESESDRRRFEEGMRKTIEGCFMEFHGDGEDFGGGDFRPEMREGEPGAFVPDVASMMERIPAEARECVKAHVTDNLDPRDMEPLIRRCMEEHFKGRVEEVHQLPSGDFEPGVVYDEVMIINAHPEGLPVPPPVHEIRVDVPPHIRDFRGDTDELHREPLQEQHQIREQYQQEFRDQYQQEYQKQYEEQYRQEFERREAEIRGQFESGGTPPSGFSDFQHDGPPPVERYDGPPPEFREEFRHDGPPPEEPRHDEPQAIRTVPGLLGAFVGMLFGHR